jgi:ankyrin repeat protein
MAALSGDEEIMSNLITRGANKDAVATSIGPVVNGAIMSGITKAVTMLIEEGVKLSGECSEDSPWLPPLSLAALISDISMFSAILDAGSESLTAKDRAAALCYASDSGRFEVVERLLGYDHEASVIQDSLDIATREKNWNVIPLLLRKCEELECEGLFKEAATGSESLVELLEQCWKYSQGTISQGLLDNCLYTATDLEKEETVVKLLDFGADPNALGKDYGNALTAACHDGNINIVKALLNKAANIDTPEGYALQAAAAQGHIEVVKLLVERDPSIVNNVSENHEARAALQAACNHNHVDVAEFLLDNGADANLGGGRFGRPIFGAIWQANQALICRLLEFEDLQLDISDSDFETTPLHFAALVLPTDQVKLLIDAKVPIDITDPNGDTALIAAAAAGDSETVKLLLEHKADFMIGNKIGMTPLNIAAQLGHGECVRLLAARASAVLSRLNEAASEGDETALQVVASEQETRSECMAREPQKLFDSFHELSKFCGALDSTDEGHTFSGPSNEGRLAPQPTDDDGSMQESSDEN